MKTTFMKLKTFTLMGLLALVAAFSLTNSREAKADAPASFNVYMGDGDAVTGGEGGNLRISSLYSENGQSIGTSTDDFSTTKNDGLVPITLSTPNGELKFTVHLNDSDQVFLEKTDGSHLAAHAGESTDIQSRTGVFKHASKIVCRCKFILDENGIPVKCINCVYLIFND